MRVPAIKAASTAGAPTGGDDTRYVALETDVRRDERSYDLDVDPVVRANIDRPGEDRLVLIASDEEGPRDNGSVCIGSGQSTAVAGWSRCPT